MRRGRSARPRPRTRHLDVTCHGAAEVHHRGRPAQQLIHREQRLLLGVGGERQDAVAQRVAGRFAAGDRQQQEELVELVAVELLAVDLRGEQRRQDVVGEAVRAPMVHQFVAVDEHFGRGLAHSFRRGGVVGVFDAQAADGVAPAERVHAVHGGNPEDVGDHLQRHLGGNVCHGVEFALVGDVGDDVARHPPHLRFQPLDVADGEALVDQRAETDVAGRIDAGQHRRVGPGLGLHQRVAPAAAEGVGVAADQANVGVFGQQPRPGQTG